MTTALVNYDAKRAAAAQKYVEQVKSAPTGDLLRVTAAGFVLGDQNLGMELAVCILNSIYVNTLYAGKYEEGAKSAPLCYAYGQPGDIMAPHVSMAEHPDVFAPQHEQCDGCPFNEYGTADTGDGKACKNKAKLAIFPVGEYVPRPKPSREVDLELVDPLTPEGQDWYRNTADLSVVIPVTSVTGFGKYVRSLAKLSPAQPPYGVITRMFVTPGAGTRPGGFTVNFEMVDLLPDEVFDLVQSRHEAMGSEMETPFSPPKEEEAPAPKQRQQPVRGLVRPAR